MLFQLGIELFQVRMLPGVAAHCQERAQLVQQGDRDGDPQQRPDEPLGQQAVKLEEQTVAPQDRRRAQRAPEQRVLQADVAIHVEALAGVVPPAAAIHPLQQFGRQPLHHGGINGAAQKQQQRAGAVCKGNRQQHRRKAVDKAERAGRHASVGKAAALYRCHHRLAYPAQKRIDQI